MSSGRWRIVAAGALVLAVGAAVMWLESDDPETGVGSPVAPLSVASLAGP